MSEPKDRAEPEVTHELQLLTCKEVAAICRISQETVRRAVRHGKLQSIKLQRRNGWRVRPAALRDWQDAGLPSGVTEVNITRSRCSSRPEDDARDSLAVA